MVEHERSSFIISIRVIRPTKVLRSRVPLQVEDYSEDEWKNNLIRSLHNILGAEGTIPVGDMEFRKVNDGETSGS